MRQTISLDSLDWTFREAGSAETLPAQVPGCVHADLLRNGKIVDPFWGTNELDLQWIGQRTWVYEATFSTEASTLALAHVELVAEGLDTLASVFVNDKRVARTHNMFVGWRWDIKKLLRAGENCIRIEFDDAEAYIRRTYPEHHPKEFNDPVGRCSVIRKEQCQFGWDWGPRFVTAGIWRSIRIEAWDENRIEHVGIAQTHGKPGAPVTVDISLACAAKRAVRVRASLSLNGEVVAQETAEGACLSLRVKQPQLWWPAGQGAQPLYTLAVELIDPETGMTLDTATRRVGLRTLRLDRHADRWGESFQFVVNGRPVFAKGASWIPAHSFVGPLRRKDYARDLQAAVAANMNMLRVWGGGVYESEDFYDLCDELGLMVWQDFMFACSLYPYETSFLDNVRDEAVYQVRRLHHRTCLALWCGNNELPQINKEGLRDPKTRKGYEALFHRLLPDVVRRHGAHTDYWPSSEWRGRFDTDIADGEISGDTHFWRVWHARHPVKDYEAWKLRFCSEFGMQSYSSLTTQNTFCNPQDSNIFGPAMENHQKNRAGNQIILDYISRRYRFPKDHASLVYLSQVNQAYCMSVAVEHYRRTSPRCMGAIYWQLNDCWPVASWSSIEFTGAWRALHYVSKRFYAPALVSARLLKEEGVMIGNYRDKASGKVELHTVYDAPQGADAVLRWELRALHSTEVIESGEKHVRLRYGESRLQQKLDLTAQLEAHGVDRIYLRVALATAAQPEAVLSEDTVFFAPPRFLELPKAKTSVRLKRLKAGLFEATFVSDVFQHRFGFEVVGEVIRGSDNFFELYPGIAKTVTLETPTALALEALRARLSHRSLVDSYL